MIATVVGRATLCGAANSISLNHLQVGELALIFFFLPRRISVRFASKNAILETAVEIAFSRGVAL